MRKIILSLVCISFFVGCHRFPNNADVDAFFINLEKKQATQESYEVTKRFLTSMRDPDSVSEDKMVEVFLNKLASYYLKLEDANVLRAVDDTPIDGGFANFVCGFYKDVIRSPAALQHYRKNCDGLRRCIGLSFSPEEVNNLCSK
jgi:hypothetical protein